MELLLCCPVLLLDPADDHVNDAISQEIRISSEHLEVLSDGKSRPTLDHHHDTGTGKASCVLATAKLIGRPVLRYHPDGRNPADVIAELGDDPVVLWIDEPDDRCIELLRLLTLQPEIRDREYWSRKRLGALLALNPSSFTGDQALDNTMEG